MNTIDEYVGMAEEMMQQANEASEKLVYDNDEQRQAEIANLLRAAQVWATLALVRVEMWKGA